jgi:hypothetical protein
MTAEQSPQTNGSLTGRAQVGHHRGCADLVSEEGGDVDIPSSSLAKFSKLRASVGAPQASFASAGSVNICSHQNLGWLFPRARDIY